MFRTAVVLVNWIREILMFVNVDFLEGPADLNETQDI
jgi:hypothetical protein